MNDNTIILQPRYVADFKCDGSKCNAKCCRSNWRIEIEIDHIKNISASRILLCVKRYYQVFSPLQIEQVLRLG